MNEIHTSRSLFVVWEIIFFLFKRQTILFVFSFKLIMILTKIIRKLDGKSSLTRMLVMRKMTMMMMTNQGKGAGLKEQQEMV